MIDVNALFKVSYGLYIVSSGNGAKGNGFVSNSVFQVTATPVQFAACCNKNNFTAHLISETKAFSISVLAQNASSEIINVFGYQTGSVIKKLTYADYIISDINNIPVVTSNALATLECRLVNTIDVGTHLIFIGEVVKAKLISDAEPMTYDYYRNVKKGLAPKNAPTYVDKSAIIEQTPNSEIYKCAICGYEHDVNHEKPFVKWDDVPETFQCPICGAYKEDFYKL